MPKSQASSKRMSNLCSVLELQSNPHFRVLEVSWFMPAAKVDVHNEFAEKHLPNAAFFDIDQVCDTSSSLPHMLPSAEHFGAALTELGIENTDHVVVYDSAGLFSAARVWWMFKVFGHECVQVLDGGLPAWEQAGGELVSGTADAVKPIEHSLTKKPFKAHLNETFLADYDVLTKNIETGDCLILDARSHGRFMGVEPEPRKGLESGHMPHSLSLPYDELIEGGRLKQVPVLRAIFAELGITANADEGRSDESCQRPIITSCGSGVTAAIITLALSEAGLGMHRLYDGAWVEWASSPTATILSGDNQQ